MLTRTHITLLLAIALAVWVITLTIQGVSVSAELLIPYGIAVSVLTFLCFGFDRWCWRFGFFNGWLVQRPWLQGTWRVKLQSSWIDPTTGKQIDSIDAYMVIRQTFTSLSLRLHTGESSSRSVSAEIEKQGDGLFRVAATYQNEPAADLRGARSEIHYGALLLNVHGEPPTRLAGHYWTDRKTSGTLELSDRRVKLVSSFEEAKSLS